MFIYIEGKKKIIGYYKLSPAGRLFASTLNSRPFLFPEEGKQDGQNCHFPPYNSEAVICFHSWAPSRNSLAMLTETAR